MRTRGQQGGVAEDERKSWGRKRGGEEEEELGMSGEEGEGVGGVRGGGFGRGQEEEKKLSRMRWRRSKKRQKTRRIPAKTQWLPWGATG